jgi:hypothetical protein
MHRRTAYSTKITISCNNNNVNLNKITFTWEGYVQTIVGNIIHTYREDDGLITKTVLRSPHVRSETNFLPISISQRVIPDKEAS